ncbi:DUF1134 domain-containing protein [Erythrobacter sp. MTPC3]|uniref:DUF1134 domain-containing protein n=1 Tax=Erythrobacter sp. MTPC3 TaxID=3056564 RepID=UPI0036F42010
MTIRTIIAANRKLAGHVAAAIGAAALAFSPAHAQEMESFDPDEAYSSAQDQSGAIDADLQQGELRSGQPSDLPPLGGPQPVPAESSEPAEVVTTPGTASDIAPAYDPAAPADGTDAVSSVDEASTYGEDDLIGAAEGVFGKGAEGLARMIEDLLSKQGEPNGYIVGREAGGAFIVGARYGSGTLFHKVEGEKKVYWTGPSVGFDAGANAANTFVLVYNLFDTEELFERFPAGEGQAYLVGGVHASYMRKGDIVLIPIRMGAGVRLGINAGYMKFSKKQRWLPF